MSYLTHITYTIRCDHCGRELIDDSLPTPTSADMADEQARDDGWMMTPDGMGGIRHRCPDCADDLTEPRPLGEWQRLRCAHPGCTRLLGDGKWYLFPYAHPERVIAHADADAKHDGWRLSARDGGHVRVFCPRHVNDAGTAAGEGRDHA